MTAALTDTQGFSIQAVERLEDSGCSRREKKTVLQLDMTKKKKESIELFVDKFHIKFEVSLC